MSAGKQEHRQPRKEGVLRGGNGEFIFKLDELPSRASKVGYTSPVIEGERMICGPGTLLYFPANVVHSTAPMPDDDVVFFAVKDKSQGMFKNTPAQDQ